MNQKFQITLYLYEPDFTTMAAVYRRIESLTELFFIQNGSSIAHSYQILGPFVSLYVGTVEEQYPFITLSTISLDINTIRHA